MRKIPIDRPIKAVLLDLDNTLIERTEAFRSFCIDLYRSNGAIRRRSTETEAVDLMVELDEGGWRDRHELFQDVIRQWPGAFRDEDEAVDLYFSKYLVLLSLASRTKSFIDDLKSSRIPMGIVTNGGSEAQWAKIRSVGLDDLVDGVVVSGDLGIWKPDSKIFDLALAKINASADSTLFIGDDPVADIRGALGVGMMAAWIRLGRDWPFGDWTPNYIIDHVWEASEIVLG